jgi:hypothetical protein
VKSTYSVSDLVATPTNSQSEIKKLRPIDNSSIVDRALEQTKDLIDPQYKKWFAKQAIRLGADRYLGAASDAREGQQPKRLFVWLLRRI